MGITFIYKITELNTHSHWLKDVFTSEYISSVVVF